MLFNCHERLLIGCHFRNHRGRGGSLKNCSDSDSGDDGFVGHHNAGLS